MMSRRFRIGRVLAALALTVRSCLVHSGAGLAGAAAISLTALPARADDLADFEHARGLYERGDYRGAAAELDNLVGTEPPRLKSAVLIAESRKYLAASRLFLGDGAGARSAFDRLLADEPDYALDPLAFPRDVVVLFEEQKRARSEQRAREAAEARAREDEVRRMAEESARRDRAMMEQLRALAAESSEREAPSRFIATIPFGVGQFQNGHRGFGTALAVAEGITAVASVVAYISHENLASKRPDTESEAAPLRELERVMRLTNITTFSVFAGLAAVGVIDAHVRFGEGRVTSRPRTLPPDLDRWLKERGLAIAADGLHF
jgi:hypothetical protein